MTDPRSPTEIGKFPTQFEAEAVAAVVRDAEIQAAVFGDGGAFAGGLGVFGQWTLLVAASDVEQARRVIIEARGLESETPVFAECPGCAYSLSGLDKPERCPECGHDMHQAREEAKTRGLVTVGRSATPAWAWNALAAGLAVCLGVGLTAILLEETGWPSIFQSWWTPLPLGMIAFAIGAVFVVRRRRKRAIRRSLAEPPNE